MLRVGLTGGIGSGKSTVAELFARKGVPIIDTDVIARELLAPGEPAHAAVIGAFGREIVGATGRIDRRALRDRIFADASSRRSLEEILHPRIRARVAERLAALDAPYCLVVVPLLVESGFGNLVDRVLVVDAPEDLQVARVATRDGVDPTAVKRIVAAQVSRQTRLQHADDVITNDADLAGLAQTVERLHARYLANSR